MHLWIQCMVIRASRDQLAFDQSPGLIAVFHALLRLLAPRHPPHALSSLAALIPVSKDFPSRFRSRLALKCGSTSYQTHSDPASRQKTSTQSKLQAKVDPEIG